MLDPAACALHGYYRTTAFNERKSVDGEQWLTIAQLECSTRVGSNDESEERPHERACLAAAGVKQYKYNWSLVERSGGVREASVEARAELNEEEYNETKGDMSKQRQGPKRKAPTKPKEPESEDS